MKRRWGGGLMRLSRCVIALLFIATLPPIASAEDKTYEHWADKVTLGSDSCSNSGTAGIVVDGPVTVTLNGGQYKVSCNEVIFKIGSRLVFDGPVDFQIGELSGPLAIFAAPSAPQHDSDPMPEPPTRGAKKRSANGRDAPRAPLFPFQRFPVASRIGSTGKPGTAGLEGTPGRKGAIGSKGSKGPTVMLHLNKINAGSSVYVEATGQQGELGHPGQLGGRAGVGGDGGRGGKGADGTYRFVPGSGGDGGRGGNGGVGGLGGHGGSGGAGGPGGDILVSFTDQSFVSTSQVPIKLVSEGGLGGLGGDGGLGGNGAMGGTGGHPGIGGSAERAARGVINGKPGAAGADGRHGTTGRRGASGRVGAKGDIGLVLQGEGNLDIQSMLDGLRLTKEGLKN
ncbi:hypothetical protein EN850_02945 [Mesorhizobium sp. M8A.F.Ca.ET.207.01.1.1]|uniref:hypothetical protein n=1 Tax=Mesorhizobium sp. M8A.F.Ca.ET.207.01.1.1 TaxID=2563968 RepID=UPI00109C6B74|nr:hypothetical protein [Mesorhizobium sp. M8A.F.Ca.ET.207.01.1.1]TGQ83716.1 hypothetical protein EN850_02945 [Mesorhizobium sp. M8A.F.Ca.ET.207.01.1.1]